MAESISDTIYIQLKAIRDELVSMRTAINNLASKQQLYQLQAIRQRELTALVSRVDDLESRLAIIENS